MGRKPAKASRSKSSRKVEPSRRRKEILGLLLMVVGLLLSLAVVTYSVADASLAKDFSLKRALDPGDNRAANALGLVGAWLAHGLVENGLGYFSLVFPVLVFGWGYLLFRGKAPVYLPTVSVLSVVGAFLAACLAGWLTMTASLNLGLFSGAWGIGSAGWMQRVFGQAGSFILLLVSAAIVGLLLVDHDVQRTIDRIEDLFRRAKEKFDGWREEAGSVRKERRERLAEQKREKETQTESDRAQRQSAAAEAAVRERERLKARAQRDPIVINDTSAESTAAVRKERTPKPRPVASALGAALAPSIEPTHPPVSEGPTFHVTERVAVETTDEVHRALDEPKETVPFEMPTLDLLDRAESDEHTIDFNELEENKQILLDKLATYNIEITDINAIVGPTVTLYELTPAPGVKISRITALEDDLAMAMAARGIRMIAPIPGKSAIGVEIPNRHRELVRVRDVIGTTKFSSAKMELPLAIGKTIEGEVFIKDLAKMPHLLIAGATGSGKSVGLNAIITGLLYACHPANLKFVMIDPKKIELQQYKLVQNHYLALPEDTEEPIITDIMQALGTLRSCEREMEERYDLLSAAHVRGIKEYNKKLASGKLKGDEHRHLPYILVVVDELADLMMTAGKDIEGPIARLAQMARAVGIHLILATQRPSVDVITGLIKANFPARIAYQVASKIDSRTILDKNGAQGLVGNGDQLYMLGSTIVRLQGPFVSIAEVDRLMEWISDQPGDGPYWLPPVEELDSGAGSGQYSAGDRDDLFEDAARIIVRSQQGSVSLLQRKLSVGYSRAARIVDQLEDAGIVGPFEGSKARQVLVADEFELDELLAEQD